MNSPKLDELVSDHCRDKIKQGKLRDCQIDFNHAYQVQNDALLGHLFMTSYLISRTSVMSDI